MKKIDEFLNVWKENAEKIYTELHEKYWKIIDSRQTWLKNHNIISYSRNFVFELASGKVTQDDINEYNEIIEFEKSFIKSLSKTAFAICSKHSKYFKNDLEKILAREVVSKRKALITRVEKKIGKIKDAEYLNIGVDGNLNGYINGELGTCKITSIYAGGYNIQSLHYRILVKIIK